MTSVSLLELAVAALLAGALASLAAARNRRLSGWLGTAFVAFSTVLLWTVVVRAFTAPQPVATLLTIPAVGAALTVKVDALSALFLAITATIALLSTLYSVHYIERFRSDTVAKYYPVLLVFFAAVVCLVVMADFLFFLVFWELMTLASFFLMTFERESDAAQRAGLKYFVLNQAGALGMLAAALVLWRHAGSFQLDALRAAMGGLLETQPALAHLLLALFYLGFATKAGVLPMGSWLADAYPAAPSSATAAFGGTSTKLGIYGLLRVFLGILPLSGATTVWGGIIALFGVGTLFVGTLTALQQDDVKRLMSFHTIGQVGYMLLGIGAGMLLLQASPALAAVALLGGIFHMANNAVYKSCLFLGAGAVEYRTGTRSLARMTGGLGAVMAGTAACALIASLSIAGVPPLNGFASKWLLYASGILGSANYAGLALGVVVAMFISLVTLASFLKYMGGAFLGAPNAPPTVREVHWSMLAPQVVLALACVGFGLVPAFALRYIGAAIGALPSAATLPPLHAVLGDGQNLGLVHEGLLGAAWAPLPIGLLLLGLALLVYWGIQRAGEAAVRDVPVWLCGENEDMAPTRYAPGSFYRPFKDAFHDVYPTLHAHVPAFPPALRKAFDADGWLYYPLARGSERAARTVSRTHVGVLQVYLLWIIVGAAAVLALVFLLAGGTP